MHLACALVGEDALQVVRVPQRLVVQRDAVPPEDSPRLPGYLDGLPHVVELAGGDVLGAYGPLVLHASDVQREQRTLLYLERHVHELLLRELEPGDRLAELLAPSGVLERRLVAVPRRAHRARDDAVAGLTETGERPAQSLRLWEHRASWEPDVFQGQVALHRDPHGELRGDVLGAEAGRICRDQEAAYAIVRLGPDHRHGGDGAHPDPTLLSVQDPAASVFAGEGLHAGRIAAGPGLGEAEATDGLALRHPWQPLPLLPLAAA